MKVKELIKQLLDEDLEAEVVLRTTDKKDVAVIDGIELLMTEKYIGYCALSYDIRLVRQ